MVYQKNDKFYAVTQRLHKHVNKVRVVPLASISFVFLNFIALCFHEYFHFFLINVNLGEVICMCGWNSLDPSILLRWMSQEDPKSAHRIKPDFNLLGHFIQLLQGESRVLSRPAERYSLSSVSQFFTSLLVKETFRRPPQRMSALFAFTVVRLTVGGGSRGKGGLCLLPHFLLNVQAAPIKFCLERFEKNQ